MQRPGARRRSAGDSPGGAGVRGGLVGFKEGVQGFEIADGVNRPPLLDLGPARTAQRRKMASVSQRAVALGSPASCHLWYG